MPDREELGSALLDCLREVSELLEYAHRTAMLQQDALTRSDAEAIAICCISQDDILRRIGQTDQRAAALAARIAEEAGLDPESANTEDIARAAGDPYAGMIVYELTRIPDIAQRVRDANEVNSQLLKNGLDIITSCLRMAACESEPTTYSKDACMAGSRGTILSLDSRV